MDRDPTATAAPSTRSHEIYSAWMPEPVTDAPAPAWLVNVQSPFPRERRDRSYGPFTEADAHAFADSLAPHWRAEVRPLFAADQVRSP